MRYPPVGDIHFFIEKARHLRDPHVSSSLNVMQHTKLAMIIHAGSVSLLICSLIRAFVSSLQNRPVTILYKSIAGHYRPVRVADRLIMARYRFIKNASWTLSTVG